MTNVGEIYTLTISGVTVKMTGNYRCVAENTKGEVTHSAMVTITDGKEPEKKPEEKKPEEKKPEEKKPEEKKPEELKPVEDEPIAVEEIVPVESVPVEAAPVEAAPVEVTGAPKFVEVYEEQTILEKKTLTLKAKITANPPPKVEWTRSV